MKLKPIYIIMKTSAAGFVALHLANCSAPQIAASATQANSSNQSPSMASGKSTEIHRKSANTLQNALTIAPVNTVKPYKIKPQERPGLGTGWGDDVASSVNFTSFKRASNKPASVDTIYYNDKKGIKAMTNAWNFKSKGLQKSSSGLVEWGVKSTWGYLENKHSSGKRFVTASKNQNYSLVVKNICKSTLEVVLSVDGLDVLDGKSASIRKRGYIIKPGKTLTVKGFRKSSNTVAAFRFSSVNSSYTNLSGNSTRNIGVMGLAIFTQKGVNPWTNYSTNDLTIRRKARAFAESPQLRAR